MDAKFVLKSIFEGIKDSVDNGRDIEWTQGFIQDGLKFLEDVDVCYKKRNISLEDGVKEIREQMMREIKMTL